MSTATRAQATALRMLTQYGQAATYRRTTRSGGASAWTPNASTSDTAVLVVPWGVRHTSRDGDRSEVRQSRFILSASGLSFTPARDDMLLIGTNTWRVIDLELTPIGGVDTVFILYAVWHG